MQDFKLYFDIGLGHILTWEAMDHILFVAALCLRYLMKDWRKVVILVTAFTIGHSITLALSALGLVHFATRWIEFLIPLTIVATAINNLVQQPGQVEHPSRLPVIYFFALFFGLIHGLAFANSLLSLVGKEGIVLRGKDFCADVLERCGRIKRTKNREGVDAVECRGERRVRARKAMRLDHVVA